MERTVSIGFAPTAQQTPTDLSWVEFSEEESQCCESLLGCDKEAVWKTHFKAECGHAPEYMYFCDPCGIMLEREFSLGRRGWGKGVCNYIFCGADIDVLKHWRYRK